ncbi:hypothetical protein MUP05_06805 [Candidatus Bathyarchaeota archaeon]|nr:hypothetical protein [Candidatus Bathyarchaeota archaeon]
MSEWPMIKEGRKGFNFYFIKLIHGPFSQELKGDAEKLIQTKLLRGQWLVPTSNAKLLLGDFRDLIERNESFVQYIRRVNDVCAQIPLRQLLDMIYQLPWGEGKTIADLRPRTPMLYPMRPERILSEFEITENEVEDLLMNFDPKAVNDLVQAMKEMQSGKLRTHEQVFCTV